jgi:hypothetical protein
MHELPPPGLDYVVGLDVEVTTPVDAGDTGFGRRRIVPISGGRVAGPAFEGTILPGGSDVQLTRPDGVSEIAARYIIETAAGTHVFIENTGIRHAPPEIMQRIADGQPVDPAAVYFRSVPRFETDDAQLRWLERDHFLATGARFPDRVRIDVYRVT